MPYFQGPAPSMHRSPESFQGTARFEVQRRLGEGAMGVVYQVYDRETHSVVALKTLRQQDALGIYRFKQEFRSLAEINHPNLVTLHELVSIGDQWFFTMELVDGLDFQTYVRNEEVSQVADTMAAVPTGEMGVGAKPVQRPATPPDDIDRLRRCMRQLAEGVHALHDAGKLHRDLKPSNVLVTPSGRVVVLDFGLVTEMGEWDASTSNSHILVGTAAYMSPEQGASRPLAPASDWYSVGVILYEALTGRVPFDGPPLAVVMEKQRSRPESPRQLLPFLPADLDFLCTGLLETDPARRPSGAEVLKQLGSQAHLKPRRYTHSRSKEEIFIGRQQHMAVLDRAFTESRRGDAIAVFIHGRAGMGKSAVLDRFVQDMQSEAVVLQGRCYERESVPYKALDDLIDSLAHYLSRLRKAEVARLLPEDAPAIARLFPVMRRVELIGDHHHAEVSDPHELRERATSALRELLRRIAAQSSLVLTLDNLQWGDVDSARLIIELIRPPDPPPLLLLACYRSEEATGSAAVRLLLRSIRTAGVNGRDLIVGALSPDETRELVMSKLGPDSPEAEIHAASLVAESGGNPFFVDELVRYILVGAAPESAATAISLEEAICTRVAQMPDGPRLLLELVAVAGRPMEQSVIADAADLGPHYASAIALLRAGGLIRTRGAGDYDRVEIYHDRIRETIVANLPPETLRAHHARLAHALEASTSATPEALVFYFHGAGDSQRAGEHAARAGDKAAGALAFDRAAELYLTAIEYLPEAEVAARDLHARLGEALANAGRGARAAAEYRQAARQASSARALDFERRAAEQLLRAGYVDEGLEALRAVLDEVGMHMASSPQRALASLISRRAQLRVRGLRFKEHDTSQISAEELTSIDVCWSAAIGLGMIDPIHGADFQTRHLLLALKAGEPYRVARALALEAMYSASGGQSAWRRTQQLIHAAEDVAERIHSAHARALAVLAGAVTELHAGHYRRAREGLERSSQLFREQCTGATFEQVTADRNLADVLFHLGDMAELRALVVSRLREAERRGDLCAATDMRTGLPNLVWLAGDDVDRARDELDLGMKRWSRNGFHLQHYNHAMAMAHVELYAGNTAQARDIVLGIWSRLQRSMLLRMQGLRFGALCLRARTAAAYATRAGDSAALDDAALMARKLAKEPLPAAEPLSMALRATVAVAQGAPGEGASLLEQAARGFDSAHMALMAAACRHRHGQILGGSEGQALLDEAEAWMRGQDIAAPARFAALLLGIPTA
jgi:eukaryotic-like serine/threonine-protein kinase